jgi:hypothetical protein
LLQDDDDEQREEENPEPKFLKNRGGEIELISVGREEEMKGLVDRSDKTPEEIPNKKLEFGDSPAKKFD